MIKQIITEYGPAWVVNRALYSLKLKILSPASEILFEKKTPYPNRLDLFDIDTDTLKAFLRELDEDNKRELIDTADNACSGVLTGFSNLNLDYRDPVDWQFNPLTGKRCDERQKWYKIPDFDKERGDIKVIWEASRFSHFITFARAYLLTNDLKYYEAFSKQLKDWLEKNPYSYGANYKCGQECSLRMVTALLTYDLFAGLGLTTDADASNMRDLIDRCYRKVLSNFFYAYRCIKNNHTISELVGLIVGAWSCGDDTRLKKAFFLLDKVIDEQFTSDGGYKQFSFNYQRLALQDLEIVLSIEDRVGQKLKNREKIKNTALLMYQCQDETGDMPNYGPNDGALVFPLTSCGYRDFRPTINAIYALITRKELYKPDKHQEELIWLGKLGEYEAVERKGSDFPDAGLFTIRNEKSWAMIVLNDYKSRPAHLDQLHFDLWIEGINVLCDSGTYSYATEEGRRLAGTGSHNTVKLEAVEQMKQHGAFLIYDWTKREIREGNCFEGTMVASGYRHTRKVQYRSGRYLITDLVKGNYEILFHTPCDVIVNGNTAKLFSGEKLICTLICDGEVKIVESIRSLYYLKQEKMNCIEIKNGQTTEIIIGGMK